MGLTALIEALNELFGSTKILNKHGFIHKSTEAEMCGVKGLLVWDFILYNEITFDTMDGNILSIFTSFSDEDTKAKWVELVDKYGIK